MCMGMDGVVCGVCDITPSRSLKSLLTSND